jgi:hypothetical protein
VRVRVGLAAAALAVTVSGCAMHNGDVLNGPNTSSGQPPIRVATAVRYVHRVVADAADVEQDVDAVEAALQALATNPDNTDQATIAGLAQLVQQQRADITGAETAFRVPTARGQIGAWEAETVLAVRNLDTALGALANYLADSSTAPAASYTRQFATGTSQWNDAVTHLWAAAGLSEPPTI